MHSDGDMTCLYQGDENLDEQVFFGQYDEESQYCVAAKARRTILGDMKTYPIPDDVKNRADSIYNKMRYQVRRGKIRCQMLFFCTYCAFLELNRDVDPMLLGEIFGLTQGEIQKCDSLFSPLQTGYKPPSVYVSPLGYLPGYCEKIDLDENSIKELVTLSKSILDKDPGLTQENPQTVAAGLFRYFIVTNGISVTDPRTVSEITGRSAVTIDCMYKKISIIDNK